MEKIILLSSTGVICSHTDDVEDILFPFLSKSNCQFSSDIIHRLYHQVCTGKCSTDEFWSYLLPGVDEPLDMIYAKAYHINEGIVTFLKKAFSANINVACSSEDNSEWISRVCRNYALDYWIKHWFISSETGISKNEKRYFKNLLGSLDISPDKLIYVSSDVELLNRAFEEGIQPILFGDSSEVFPYALNISKLSVLLFESKEEFLLKR